MRTRGSERASREAKAVQWRTFRGGIEKLVEIMKKSEDLTNNVGAPDSSVGPPSAAQKLVKDK